MEETCKNCRWWENTADEEFGVCTGIVHKDSRLSTDIAYVTDYEGYSADLYTKSMFSCIMFVTSETPQ